MVKKIFLFTALMVLLVATSVSAFDLVEQKASVGFGLGLEGGVAFGRGFFTSFYGVAGNYSLNPSLVLKGSIGVADSLAWDEVHNSYANPTIYFTAKPAYYLLNKPDLGLYGFAVVSNLTPNLLTLGIGLGTEFVKLNDSIKIVDEASFSVDGILTFTGGFKIYF